MLGDHCLKDVVRGKGEAFLLGFLNNVNTHGDSD
jgi:hypothetical protein